MDAVDSVLIAARVQFAITISFHIVLAATHHRFGQLSDGA